MAQSYNSPPSSPGSLSWASLSLNPYLGTYSPTNSTIVQEKGSASLDQSNIESDAMNNPSPQRGRRETPEGTSSSSSSDSESTHSSRENEKNAIRLEEMERRKDITNGSKADMENGTAIKTVNRPKSCFGCRHTFALMGFLGLTVMYLMRTNLSVAIVDMIITNTTNSSPSNTTFFSAESENEEQSTCPYEEDQGGANKTDNGEFDWDSKAKGQVLGSFFWGYIITQIPGGILAERFGGKWVIGIAIFICNILSFISPLVARSGGYGPLMGVRLLMGLAQGVIMPAITSMVSKWVPSLERTTIGAFVMAGNLFGTIIVFPLSGWLCAFEVDNGWPLAFYIPGAIGIIWFIGWFFLVYDNPTVHPRISEDEKRYILASSGKSKNRSVSSTPWPTILSSIRVWAIVVAHFGQNWGYSMLITQLPSYMRSILHFDLKANGLLSALPYLIMWLFSIACSITADTLRRKGILSTTATRKLFTTIGLFLPACGLIGATFTGCDRLATVVLLSLSSGFNGANNSGFYVNYIDVASNFAGSLMGISQTVANSCGFIVPAVVGLIVTNEESLAEWQTVFFLSAGMYIAGNIFYLIFGTGEEQPWNKIPDEEEPVRLGIGRVVLSYNQIKRSYGGKKEKKGCRTDVCPRPYVSVEVDGIGKVTSALVDTGATGSSIKREIAREFRKSKGIPTHFQALWPAKLK